MTTFVLSKLFIMKKSLYLLTFLCLSALTDAQVYQFAEDDLQRGWYNRPYQRYEAEPDYCLTNGIFLEQSDNQRLVQSEASHQQAVQLIHHLDSIHWIIDKAGRGFNIRFSLPDSPDGNGTKGNFRLTAYKGNDFYLSQDFILDSYWAWQYTVRNGNYPDNAPSDDKMVRMKFDEKHFLLNQEVPAGAVLKIEKLDNNDIPYTIDFIELEPVPEPKMPSDYPEYSDIIEYHPSSDGDLNTFVWNNQGKTIYVPTGRIEVPSRIYMNTANTRLIGAGEWWTELYFNASSNDASTYSKRGIEGSGNYLVVEGLSLNTVNNQRYYQNNDSKQVGKGFQGGFGTGSVIRNCWVEHFECGAWIGDYSGNNSKSLLVENCRFRNNYADGINLCKASTNHTVRNCSFRNNGDDDMASWSTGNLCSGCVFEYCTAENNWRASSLAFFGGQNQTAHHIAVYDALECGVRATTDFIGTGFKTEGRILLHDISISHSGCKSGIWGQAGDFWGNMQGALTIAATANYDINNLELYDFIITDSRTNAIYLRGSNGKKINNLVLQDFYIENADGYGIYYSGAQGSAKYCNLTFINCGKDEQSAHMATFVIDESCNETDLDSTTATIQPQVEIGKGEVILSNINGSVELFDYLGRLWGEWTAYDTLNIPMKAGIWLLFINNKETIKIVIN